MEGLCTWTLRRDTCRSMAVAGELFASSHHLPLSIDSTCPAALSFPAPCIKPSAAVSIILLSTQLCYSLTDTLPVQFALAYVILQTVEATLCSSHKDKSRLPFDGKPCLLQHLHRLQKTCWHHQVHHLEFIEAQPQAAQGTPCHSPGKLKTSAVMYAGDMNEARGHLICRYIPMAAGLLPPLLVVVGNSPSDSGKVHSDVRQRWQQGDRAVHEGMAAIADLAERGRYRFGSPLEMEKAESLHFASVCSRLYTLLPPPPPPPPHSPLFPRAGVSASKLPLSPPCGFSCRMPA